MGIEVGVFQALESEPKEMITTCAVREECKGSVRVLLAEDDLVNQKLILQMMKKAGYAVDIAKNGREAIDMVKLSAYDIVLMDMQMPVMGGVEATEEIRKAGFDDMPIVAVTANVFDSDRERCMAAGMDDFLPKPISRDGLYGMIEKWVLDKPFSDFGHEQVGGGSGGDNDDNRELAVFDRVKALDMIGNNSKILREVVDCYLGDIPRRVSCLRGAFARQDTAEAARIYHSIKGGASQIAAERTSAVALKAEKAAKMGDIEVAEGYLADVERECEQVKQAIEAIAW